VVKAIKVFNMKMFYWRKLARGSNMKNNNKKEYKPLIRIVRLTQALNLNI
jgi:hypothetical protein